MKYLFLVLLFFSLSIQSQSIYEDLPATGEIIVTLHPGETVTPGSTHLISMGVPFPRNTVNNVSQIIVTDNQDNEQSSYVRELVRWHSLSNNSNVFGVRSALLYFNVVFTTLDPITVKVKYGENRTLELGGQRDVKRDWVTVKDPEDEYLDDPSNLRYVELKEPAVYATLPPDWMSKCVIRTKFIPSNSVSTPYEWHNDAMINFGASAINDVEGSVLDINKVNVYDRAPWLFDRAGVFWNLYFRTGDLKWLKSAHRATQFYSKFLDTQGRFILGNPSFLDDLKYSYGGSMLIDLMLTGDLILENKIRAVAGFAATQNFNLESNFAFWTERHFSYWLLGALSAFEVTGETIYKDQVNERAAHAFFRADNPVNGYQPDAVLLHPMGPHEGANRPPDGEPDVKGYYQPIISPWLSALLSDAIWRYYLHSEDVKALGFLSDLGTHVARYCIYEVSGVHLNIDGNKQPYYLFSGQTASQFERNGIYWQPWDDDKHAPDVAGLLARAYWAQKKLGLDTSEVIPQINNMVETSKYTINAWTRTDPLKPKYRLQPARKFNWQFGTTSDFEWLMLNEPKAILSTTNFEREQNKNEFYVYPNPVKNRLSLGTTEIGYTKLDIDIFDIKGVKVKTYSVENIRENNILNLSNLSSGEYLVKIYFEDKEETVKLVKL